MAKLPVSIAQAPGERILEAMGEWPRVDNFRIRSRAATFSPQTHGSQFIFPDDFAGNQHGQMCQIALSQRSTYQTVARLKILVNPRTG